MLQILLYWEIISPRKECLMCEIGRATFYKHKLVVFEFRECFPYDVLINCVMKKSIIAGFNKPAEVI